MRAPRREKAEVWQEQFNRGHITATVLEALLFGCGYRLQRLKDRLQDYKDQKRAYQSGK